MQREAYSKGDFSYKNVNRIDKATGAVNVDLLLRKVRVTLGKMYGTAEERGKYLRRAWNLPARYGGVAIFLTVNPNDICSGMAAIYAGELNCDSAALISNMLGYNRRAKIAGQNPFACVIYFNEIIYLLVEELLRFDRRTKKSKPGGGILGVIRAYAGGVESQTRQTLHSHMILYLSGFPDNYRSFHELCETPGFQKRIAEFLDSIVSTSGNVKGMCLSCNRCEGSKINSVYFEDKAFRKPLRNALKPCTAVRKGCGQEFGGYDLMRISARDWLHKCRR